MIPQDMAERFNVMLRAAANGDLALLECEDAATKEPRFVICAVGYQAGEYQLTPFGHFAPGDPYAAYLPPDEPPPLNPAKAHASALAAAGCGEQD